MIEQLALLLKRLTVVGRFPIMMQEQPILPEHLSLLGFVWGIVSCVVFVDHLSVCPFALVIIFSVLLRMTASDYPFGIFKLSQ